MGYKSKVEICGVNTSHLEVLTAEQKEILLRKTAEGDKDAREQLIKGNLKLVLSIIRRFSSRNENPDDMFQVGCIGLIKAVDNFDLSHGVQFSTYAVPMIIGELKRYLRDNTMLRVSRSMRDNAYKALAVREQLTNKTGKEPTLDEIAAALGVEKQELSVALDAIVEPMSLNEPLYNDDGDAVYVMDKITDDGNNSEKWLERIAVEDALKQLSPRDRRIILMRYYAGKTQVEVADEIAISQAQVSRIEKNALLQMRHHLS